MAGKRRKGSTTRRVAGSGARPVAATKAAHPPSGFRWRTWLVRSLVVGVAVTLVTLGTSPPKHTDAGSLIPAIVEAIVVYAAIFFVLACLWELILRFRRGAGPRTPGS